MRRSHIYYASDDTSFETAAECKEYEEGGRLLDLLNGLTHSRIKGALDRTDTELADAIERAGNIIARKRRESGEMRRAKKSRTGEGSQ